VTGASESAPHAVADDLAKIPGPPCALPAMNGDVYEGVWLHEVLKKAGVPQGSELRARRRRLCLAEAQDGYQVLFSSENSTAFIDNEILLADPRWQSPVRRAGPDSAWCAKDKPGGDRFEC